MKRRLSDRFRRGSTHDPKIFDRLSNVAAHQLPNRVVQQQILSSFTERLQDLPAPEDLITRGRSLAIVEIALVADPAQRHHVYETGPGERRLSVRQDSGSTGMLWLGPAGSVIRGYDHHSDMAPDAQEKRRVWPGVVDHFPPSLADCPTLPETEGVENVTFVYWWFSGGPWTKGPVEFPAHTDTDPDGSWHVLRTLSSDKEALRFLGDTYGGHFSDEIIDDFARPRVFEGMIQTLPITRNLGEIMDELVSVGYLV